LLTQGEPLDQPVSCIFYKVFTILQAEDRGERRPQTRLSFIEQHIREVSRATVAQMEAFGMRSLMRQTGKRGQPGIRVDSIPRQRVCAEKYRILRLVETRPRGILYCL
jgi:hypothetical protein